MTFPNHPDKYDSKPVFSPDDLMKYQDTLSSGFSFKAPENVILCYSPGLMEYVRNNYEVSEEKLSGGALLAFNNTAGKVGIMGNFGFGAPVAVIISEVLITSGTRRIMNIGVAGTLQKHVCIGDVVVCRKAIRDEGTSYHYLRPDTYAYPGTDLTEKIVETLNKKRLEYCEGTSWTIDTPYRETVAEVVKYQEEGVLTVEMEASALFVLGQHRDVDTAALFTISDSLAELEWAPEFRSEKTLRGLETVFEVSLETLSGL